MDRNRIQTSRSSENTQHITSSLPTQKLKDSCDKCSASKVRCTKEKPLCARCDKLGYTCFYSLARRAGRPYRSKKQLSEGGNGEETSTSSTRDLTTNQFVDESARIYSRFNASSTPVDVTSNSSISNSTPEQHDSNITKSHDASDPDCLLVALDILSEIEVPAEQMRRVSPGDTNLLNTTAQTVTAAFQRLSAVLICPCSERAEVGMLVSAICMSIIDMHALTIANIAKDQPPTRLVTQPMTWDNSSIGSHRSPEYEVTAIHIFVELSELAKLILQLTERFDEGSEILNRESLGNGSELPTDFLPGMATFLRERLQLITNDATHWLG
ncbi:hypothetical protein N7517_006206 [Penicillium concentricum]|uniref:Zn(2)-C6 fungal-type domain-containing protein n=1 Tax=Penicillium concentricum TaxID=293559 RepID=A0A9W9VC84_9EURO|nr:uncharacterized protein N7517_006206 [Penicillium concentricum]KAJ5374200.1 hypothetical protein N7517_006206 [Penicillium concentricum]